MSAPVVEAREATRNWGPGVTIGPVSLCIEAGERVTLMGPNGAGKSTLLRMVAALTVPSSGGLAVAGSRAGSMSARRALSYLPDHPVLYDDLSLWEQCEYVARLHRSLGWQKEAESLFERVGLAQRADDLPSTYSRGMRAKAAIVMALIRPFQVLVADEPLQGLDVGSQAVVLELLEERAERGAALFVATHRVEHLPRFERLVTIIDGAITYDGPPDEEIALGAVG